ncbi:MAG: hypothetical protein A2Y14_03550 [Verrucomicrobia bacterium GWF2_51_19]|nr:MAG: hypothetical protein A2Y14_03550 [Verrucomicrobia bacterium GWF2_51_19]
MPLSAYSATSTGASSDASGANAIALPAIKRIPTRKLEVPQKKVSYKEFVNTKGLPKKATAAVSVPKLQVKNITTANAKSAATSSAIGASGAAGTSNVPPSVLQQYLAKMRSDIEGFWEKPPAHTALKATVEFQISESGQLLYATIKEPSGSQPFDNSILKAFKQNPQWDQPPERKKMTFTLVFEAI